MAEKTPISYDEILQEAGKKLRQIFQKGAGEVFSRTKEVCSFHLPNDQCSLAVSSLTLPDGRKIEIILARDGALHRIEGLYGPGRRYLEQVPLLEYCLYAFQVREALQTISDNI